MLRCVVVIIPDCGVRSSHYVFIEKTVAGRHKIVEPLIEIGIGKMAVEPVYARRAPFDDNLRHFKITSVKINPAVVSEQRQRVTAKQALRGAVHRLMPTTFFAIFAIK